MSDDNRNARSSLKYDAATDTYRVEYSDGTDPPSSVVVESIASITDRDRFDLDPLYQVVDPDALDALFEPRVDGCHRGEGEVTFAYHGYEVAVRSYGVIAIQSAEGRG